MANYIDDDNQLWGGVLDVLDLQEDMPREFYDVAKVLQFGARKYSEDGWLHTDSYKMSHKENHDSMFHHLAMSFSGQRLDTESQLDHLLHLSCRALMQYTRIKRGITHERD